MEYKIEIWSGRISEADDYDLQEKLDGYAAENWELINIIPQLDEGTTACNIFVFKKSN